MTENEKKEYDSLVANMEQMKLRLDELTARRPAVYGYARVSTKGQAKDGNSLEAQMDAIRNSGAEKIFVDSFTGTKMERPEFSKLLKEIKDGDTLIVSKLDRFARSVGQASDLITELIDRGVTVNVLNLGILSNNSVSTLMRNVLLSFAQFERDMIVQRTQEGKAIAKLDPNFREGRPPVYSREQKQHALELLESGKTFRQVERMTGLNRSTLIRARRDQKTKSVTNTT